MIALTPGRDNGYAKDDAGEGLNTTPGLESSVADQVGYFADTDEVGIYNPNILQRERTCRVCLSIYPPVEYESVNDHLNLLLASPGHVPYQSVQITIPASNVTQVYAYPPSLTTEKTRDTYTFTGSVAPDENVAVELLLPPVDFPQIPG